MYLKKIKSYYNKLSFRLAFTFLSFFIPCYLITFGIFYLWTAEFLKNRDRDLIDGRINQYQEIVEKEGVRGLRLLYEDTKSRSGSGRYLVELSDLSGEILFLHLSEEMDPQRFDLKNDLIALEKVKHDHWFYLRPTDPSSASIEIKTYILNNDLRLSVGASTEVRDALLHKFQIMFLTILIPLLLSSIILSIFIANKFLTPVTNLARLIQKIREGSLSSRASLPETEDELFELTDAFNGMISQVEFLINAMKETLDNVAHDLRTPLARARLASELALKSNDSEKLKSAVEENVESLDLILGMIQTIMTMSGLGSKTLALNKEEFLTSEIIADVIDLYQFVAEEKNIVLHSQIESTALVFADKLMIRQALANLIDNAIKYSSDGSVVRIKTYQRQNMVYIEVIDEGVGISSDDLPRIWERLFRADKSRSEKGFGLGLSLVKIFIESNGGQIEVESILNKGSVFRFSLMRS